MILSPRITADTAIHRKNYNPQDGENGTAVERLHAPQKSTEYARRAPMGPRLA